MRAPYTLPALLVAVVDGFRRRGGTLLAVDLLYKGAAFAVLWPLTGLAFRGFIAVTGRDALADQDILHFLLSPVGLAGAVLVAAAVLTVVALEIACQLLVIRTDEHLGATRAVLLGLGHGRAVLRVALRVIVRVLLISAPFLAALIVIYAVLLRDHDINFYLANRPPRFWIAVVLGAVVVAGLAAALLPRLAAWTLALPLVLFDGVAPRAALRSSAERTRGHRGDIAVAIAGWAVGSVLLSAGVLALTAGLARLVIPVFSDAIRLLVPIIGGIVLLMVAASVLVSSCQTIALGLLVAFFDRTLRGAGGPDAAAVPATPRTADLGRRFARLSARSVLAGAALAVVAAGVIGVLLLGSVRVEDDVLVIAHRGGAGAPENSLAAIRLGLDAGADMIEIDVQETADGEVVVFHDSDFMRAAGRDLKIWDATSDELRGIDIGRGYAPTFEGERVPTLADVLELCRGRAVVNIELKDYGRGERLAERVAAAVDAAGMGDEVVAMSLNHELAREMKRLRPGWPVGLLAATGVGDLTHLEADFLALSAGVVDRSFVRRAHARGRDVYVWTVNDAVQMSRMISLGVDGLITDEPGLARDVLAQRASMSSAERLLLQAAYYIGLEPSPAPQ